MSNRELATQSLAGSLAGDRAAQEELLALVYDDLRQLAAARMSAERPEHTLQPTSLVHEAFMRLVDQEQVDWQGRTHFFAIAATTMRRVLIDHARSKASAKRGNAARKREVDEADAVRWEDPAELLALDEALSELAQLQPRQARVVELRFFGGLTLDEAAAALEVSRDTVKLDWRFARAWLSQRLGDRPID